MDEVVQHLLGDDPKYVGGSICHELKDVTEKTINYRSLTSC